MVNSLLVALTRKKRECFDTKSKLAGALNLFDLISLGLGTTLGLGVYVLAGSQARDTAGPAVAVSFFIAAIASAVAGVCYAEFAARVPKAGSAYVYSYVTVGEFVAFVIGWNLVLEFVIGTASVARGFTNYLDSLVDYRIEETQSKWFPMHISFLSPYVDLVSFGLISILTVLLSIGVKESTRFNNVFTVLNMVTIATVIIGGSLNADISNWKIERKDIPYNVTWAGKGGFFPFGFKGVMAGAAKCFYGFVGFDSIATTGEEALNPQRDIPLAIVVSLFIVFFSYFGISTVITLAWPYYDQDKDAPFPVLFENLNQPVLKWVVSIGAMCALCTSLLGAMFPLPRVLYSMGEDGLVYKFFSNVHPKFKTPLTATVISGISIGLMASIFNLEQLINMSSIGTLMAYTIVAICVLILRYEPMEEYSSGNNKRKKGQNFLKSVVEVMSHLGNEKRANIYTSAFTKWATCTFGIFSFVFCAFMVYAVDRITPSQPLFFVPFILTGIFLIIIMISIGKQPVDEVQLSFKAPWVPFIPCLCILINSYLMLELDANTWIRFVVWFVAGMIIYFSYGIYNSKEAVNSGMSERKS